MANQSGTIYGLTALSPIVDDPKAAVPHHLALRAYLASLPRDHRSPLSTISSTHLARLVVLDDLFYVGFPANRERLQSRYLVFTSNFDGDLDVYLTRMAQEVPEFVREVWGHCVGYPGADNFADFARYITRCQVTTTFLFADVNYKTVQETLKALQVQAEVAAFIEECQGRPAQRIQDAFARFTERMRTEPAPVAGSSELVLQPAASVAGSELPSCRAAVGASGRGEK